MGAPRKSSASATGGRMLNPSVEPTARRESTRERRDSEGKARRDSASANPRENKQRPSVGGRDSVDAGISGSVLAAKGADSTTSAAEARNQRRSIGLQRLSVNTHMKESLIHALENVARNIGVGTEGTAIDTLQAIMTEAKEKGLGVSTLFHFFLLQSDGTKRASMERRSSKSQEEPEDSTKPEELKHEATGGVFRETQSSKTRAEAINSRGGGKKKSMELMPSLQKGNRPGTASSKRSSAGGANTDAEHRPSGSPKEEEPTTKEGAPPAVAPGRRRSSIARRSSSVEEAMMRDRLITTASFQQGLTTLGFKLSDKEAETMFQHLDINSDGNIDLAEFTRFCLEIPSMPWKAERARRGILGNNPGVQGDRELDRAAREMANETIAVSDATAEFGLQAEAQPAKLEPAVDLGKKIYRGEKFFWRTKDLIEVVIQLNEKKGFLAVTMFHTERLQVYPTIFVDPAKIPDNATAEGEILNDLKAKELTAKTDLDMGGQGGGEEKANNAQQQGQGQEEEQTLKEKAHMAYIADYIVHRITMPDGNGDLLQPDVTRPQEEVNPALPEDGQRGSTSSKKTRRGSAVARPGLMRTTFDEWDTLLVANPPSRVDGTPQFAKTKKRESYFQEFCNVTEAFQENRVKAHRLSNEAAELAMQVANTLAPLNHSASAPATLPLHESQQNSKNDENDGGINGDGNNPRPGSGRIVLEDDISTKRDSATRKSLLESQSAPVLRQSVEALAA